MRPASSVPASVDPAGDSIDRLIGFLEDRLAQDARAASTQQDVIDLAFRVRLLQLHRPIVVEVLAITDADGSNYEEVGFLAPDGTYIGVSAPRILCDYHDDAEDWPCPAVRSLARRYGADSALENSGHG